MNRDHKIKIILNLVAAIFLVALTGEYNNSHLAIIENLEKQSYDWRLQREEDVKRDDIVIVDIDRDTLRAFGNWPFERSLFADLNEQLFNKYRVRLAAYTLPFPQADDSALHLLNNINKKINQQLPIGFSSNESVQNAIDELRQEYDYDSRFTDTLKKNPIVLGYIFDQTGRVEGVLPEVVSFIDGNQKSIAVNYLKSLTQNWSFYSGFSGNQAQYLRAVKTSFSNSAGHINYSADADGIIRHAPYFIFHAGGYYPSLPLATYMRLQKEKDVVANVQVGFGLGSSSLEEIAIGKQTVPINNRGDVYINYLNHGGRNVNFEDTPEAAFRYLSFVDVIKGKVPLEHLDDKIVFIGSSAKQLRLLFPTPVNNEMPGVEIAATQLANLIDGEILSRGDGQFSSELLLLLIVAILLSVIFIYISPIIAFVILLITIFGYFQFVLYQWHTNYEIWTLVPTIITLVGLFIVNTIVGFVFEWRSNRHLQSTFGQYVPPEFAKKIGEGGNNINLEGELRQLSVLFSDVRNFTAISEKLTPRELTLLMNNMLTSLSEVIHNEGGTVDKYIGDAIMAFWNAPLFEEKHAERSVLAAMKMQAAMQKLSDDLVKKGFKPMHLGVGICTGDANVGNMGSELRMTYTAIGDTVNLASRTEGLTKYYSCPILVTESTYEQCDKDVITFRAIDMVRVKGRNKPALLYQPMGITHRITPETLEEIEQFEKMRQLYIAGDFAAAQQELDIYCEMSPDDGLVAIYRERLEMLLKNPPDEWDGITIHKTK